ncbi:hypothetical protein JQ628_06375 [Bradyrhizobium lablabi]|uniref:hypothetical protein n=1 Tax=Bradyrhizobium lablabi TaxID=722472 RepID=UPI001BA91E66|nr:hypothetical protein [Bradyrhizobium lablabi]MBR1121132.1 hypothetical protein [Bradyrhizobium lablabi]
MKLVCFFVSLVLAVLASTMAVTSASAQGVIIVGNLYEETKSASCFGAGNSACHLIFNPAPPTNKILITDVSCLFTHTQPIAQSAIAVSDSPTSGPFRRFEYFPAQTGNAQAGNTFSAAKFKTNFLFGEGKYPAIYFNMVAVGTGQITCKIVGVVQP